VGTTGGAVYGIGEPLGQPETLVAVTAGTAAAYGVFVVAAIAGIAGLMVKKPQPDAQTSQSTPAAVVSLATAAIRLTAAFGASCAGSEGTKLIESVVLGTIEIGLELRVTLDLATEVAVTVTEVPVVVAGGAV
jgi:hypothetical protein